MGEPANTDWTYWPEWAWPSSGGDKPADNNNFGQGNKNETYWGEVTKGVAGANIDYTVGLKATGVLGMSFALYTPVYCSNVVGWSMSNYFGNYYSNVRKFVALGGNSTATISGNYSQTIGGTGYKHVNKNDFTIGGFPMATGLPAPTEANPAAMAAAVPLSIPIQWPIAKLRSPTPPDTATTAEYQKVDVKYEIYYGNTYKWIKGGKYEREGADPSNKNTQKGDLFVNDTANKTILSKYLSTFVQDKAKADKAKTAWALTPNDSTLSSAAIIFTAPASDAAAEGLGTMTVFAKTREATIGTSTTPGSCSETINGTKEIIATSGGVPSGLRLLGSQAQLGVSNSGLAITATMVTIGPKVSLGSPAAAIKAANAKKPDTENTLNKKLEDLQSETQELMSRMQEVEGDEDWDDV